MSKSRKLRARQASEGDLKACALCAHPRWFHQQSRDMRRLQDWRDNGHVYNPHVRSAEQMRLPFNTVTMPAKVDAVAKKKPPVRITAKRRKKSVA